MERRAQDIRLAPLPGHGPEHPGEGPRERRFTVADLDAAGQLAEFHRMLASELEPRSELRGLVLRCAGHWSRLGAIPRNGLTEVDRGERD